MNSPVFIAPDAILMPIAVEKDVVEDVGAVGIRILSRVRTKPR